MDSPTDKSSGPWTFLWRCKEYCGFAWEWICLTKTLPDPDSGILYSWVESLVFLFLYHQRLLKRQLQLIWSVSLTQPFMFMMKDEATSSTRSHASGSRVRFLCSTSLSPISTNNEKRRDPASGKNSLLWKEIEKDGCFWLKESSVRKPRGVQFS